MLCAYSLKWKFFALQRIQNGNNNTRYTTRGTVLKKKVEIPAGFGFLSGSTISIALAYPIQCIGYGVYFGKSQLRKVMTKNHLKMSHRFVWYICYSDIDALYQV